MSKGSQTLLTGLVAFAGGVIAGLLLTPKSGRENRQWLHDQSEDAKEWLEGKSHRLLEEGEKKIEQVSRNLKKSVKENLPDLYEATETLHLDEEELEQNV
ncbi:YtxH domain-containing protein [Balneola vulgaris]|jgi:gas vesicle protein|uniref:YtxH domain-containing protein n=1 Tax=Balneola vulgaris TaxID=287535 RepID=UPI00036D2398|nr:YtxH domain-containing protein [Balneola vulgaris]